MGRKVVEVGRLAVGVGWYVVEVGRCVVEVVVRGMVAVESSGRG